MERGQFGGEDFIVIAAAVGVRAWRGTTFGTCLVISWGQPRRRSGNRSFDGSFQ